MLHNDILADVKNTDDMAWFVKHDTDSLWRQTLKQHSGKATNNFIEFRRTEK